MRLTFRPLPAWPHPSQKKRPATYQSSYEKTLADLEHEIDMLHGSEVVIGVVADEAALRFDGRLKANARLQHAGVELSFEVPGGRRLVFHTDVHEGHADSWKDNLRAITLGLGALRAIDRYGITASAEQYAEFAQLGAGGADAERGRRLVEAAGGIPQALKRHHPDHGGDLADFADVQAYRAGAAHSSAMP